MNTQTQPPKKLAFKKQSIRVLSASQTEQHFPTLDC